MMIRSMVSCLSNIVLNYIGIGRYPSKIGLKMKWNFFESSHGKGEHDGASVVIK